MRPKEDKLELRAVVDEALPNTMYRVTTENDLQILVTVGGQLRRHNIRIIPGDQVTVQVSPYDPSRGRITRRHK